MKCYTENRIVQTFNSIIRRINKQTNKCIAILMDAEASAHTHTHAHNPIAMAQVQLVCFLTLAFIEVCLAHIQPAINYYPGECAIPHIQTYSTFATTVIALSRSLALRLVVMPFVFAS